MSEKERVFSVLYCVFNRSAYSYIDLGTGILLRQPARQSNRRARRNYGGTEPALRQRHRPHARCSHQADIIRKQEQHRRIRRGRCTCFSSTTIFVDIQNSINEIWRVKATPKKGWLTIIVDRLLSFSMIIGLGFLLMTSLILSSIISILLNYVGKYFPQLDVHLLSLVNSGVSFLVVAVLFGFVFADRKSVV